MASSKGASISGSWTANAAPGDAMVSRQATATDGVNTKVAEDERPGYFRFKESAEARYRYLKAV
jgi:hypothetical protein